MVHIALHVKIQRRGGGFQVFLTLCHTPGVDKGVQDEPSDRSRSVKGLTLHAPQLAKAPFRAVVGHKKVANAGGKAQKLRLLQAIFLKQRIDLGHF